MILAQSLKPLGAPTQLRFPQFTPTQHLSPPSCRTRGNQWDHRGDRNHGRNTETTIERTRETTVEPTKTEENHRETTEKPQ